jgi:hypothetical protein
MKRHVQTIVALLWLILGVIGATWTAYHMWQNRNVSGNVLKGDAMGLGFCILGTFSAFGYLKGVRAARFLLTLTSAVLALYCLSYVLMVGSEFGSVWLVTFLLLLGFAVATGTVVLLTGQRKRSSFSERH